MRERAFEDLKETVAMMLRDGEFVSNRELITEAGHRHQADWREVGRAVNELGAVGGYRLGS